MDERISLSELADHISRVCRDEAQANDEDDGSAISSVLEIVEQRRGCIYTYGAIPMDATAAGSERTPTDTVSAIMTAID